MSFPTFPTFFPIGPLGQYSGYINSGRYKGNMIELFFNIDGSVQGSIIKLVDSPYPDTFPTPQKISSLNGQYNRHSGQISLRTAGQLMISGRASVQRMDQYRTNLDIVGREDYAATAMVMLGGYAGPREFRANLNQLKPQPIH